MNNICVITKICITGYQKFFKCLMMMANKVVLLGGISGFHATNVNQST